MAHSGELIDLLGAQEVAVAAVMVMSSTGCSLETTIAHTLDALATRISNRARALLIQQWCNDATYKNYPLASWWTDDETKCVLGINPGDNGEQLRQRLSDIAPKSWSIWVSLHVPLNHILVSFVKSKVSLGIHSCTNTLGENDGLSYLVACWNITPGRLVSNAILVNMRGINGNVLDTILEASNW